MLRLAYALFTIWIILTIIFLAVRMLPGDPAIRILGENASPEQIQDLREKLFLDRSIVEQYRIFMSSLLKLNLGSSYFSKKDVFNLLKSYFPATFILAVMAMLVAASNGIFLGVLSAQLRGYVDSVVRFCVLLFLALPIFSLAPLLVYIFAIKMALFPVSGWGDIYHAILPVVALALPLMAVITRVTRHKFLEEKKGQWVLYLRAKGLGKVAITWRILQYIFPSILNVLGIQLSVILAGAMVSESIFDVPGMGMLLFSAIQNRDYPVIQGVIIYISCIYMIIYFLVDYGTSLLDRRIK